MTKRERWKSIIFYSLHFIPVILIFIFAYTDIPYNFKEPVYIEDYSIRVLSFIILLTINIFLLILRTVIFLSRRQRLVAKIILWYLGISSMISIFFGAFGMKFHSPDKTNIITFESHCMLIYKSVWVRKSYLGLFSVPIKLADNYRLSYSIVNADFKWFDENNLYVKIYPEEEHVEYPAKYYSIIDLKKSEIITKEQYESLNAKEYSFEP